MTRKFYQILEISEKATCDEIKRAYKKQALKWHPDKNPDNREEAEKRFKEISKAFQILSVPTTRIFYDVYGEGFENLGSDSNNSSSREENLRKAEEELRKAREERRQTEAEYLATRLKGHFRYITILDISSVFIKNVLKGVTEKDLDFNLWHPYPNWREKVYDLEGEELEKFKLQMISAIEEIAKGKKEFSIDDILEEAYDASIPEIKAGSIKSVQQWLKNESIELEELEPENRDYQAAINNAGETIDKVIDVERRIKEDIVEKARLKREEKPINDQNLPSDNSINDGALEKIKQFLLFP